MTSTIQIEDARKHFATGGLWRRLRGAGNGHVVRAVDGVSMEIRDGEIYGLVGPNGAGKTTLIKLVCALLRLSGGRIRVCGHDTRTSDFQVRRLVGLVTSNERSFYWRLTGRRNLEFFARLYRIPDDEARRWIDQLLAFLELHRFADQRFDGYSTGIKQRFAIARGLLSKPRVLLMDEPTKGVDPVAAADIIGLIRNRLVELWHPTVLVTSHNLREIELICDRVAVMHLGRLIASGTVRELRNVVQPVEVYRLRVRKLNESMLNGIATLTDGELPVRFGQSNGITEVEVRIGRDSDALHQVVSHILAAGGELVGATAVEHPFDDIFASLIRRVNVPD